VLDNIFSNLRTYITSATAVTRSNKIKSH